MCVCLCVCGGGVYLLLIQISDHSSDLGFAYTFQVFFLPFSFHTIPWVGSIVVDPDPRWIRILKLSGSGSVS